MSTPWVLMDFETSSACDLKAAGAWRYAEDPTTEVLCLSYTDGKDIWVWLPGDKLDPILEAAINNPEVIFVAFNVAFEKSIWRRIMVEQFGWPDIPNSRWHDVQAVCAMRVLPLALEDAVRVLKLPHQKDMEGAKILRELMKPSKKGWMEKTPEKLAKLYDYCKADVAAELDAHLRLGWLPPGERNVWLLDQRINERGLHLDMNYIAQARKIVDEASVPLAAEFRALTGYNYGQRDKVLKWVQDRGVPIRDLRKETVVDILGKDIDADDESNAGEIEPIYRLDIDPDVHRALEIRQLVNSASVKKLARMEACVCADSRARGLLQYHGTGPGRRSGRLLQPQNFPRPTIELDDKPIDFQYVVDAILTGDAEYVNATIGPPVETVVSGLRHAVTSGPGRVLVSGDYAGIQARVVLALAGQHDKTALMAAGKDIYCDMAERIYKRPIDKKKDPIERQTGKNCFAADTLVLTPRGYVPIVLVRSSDKVWDGQEWVQHQGLVRRGVRLTCTTQGIWATPEHPVLCGEQWQHWENLAHDANMLCRALATGSANLPSWATDTGPEVASFKSLSSARAWLRRMGYQMATCAKVHLHAAMLAPRKAQIIGARNFMGTLTSCQTNNIGCGCSTESQPASDGVKGKPIQHTVITASVAFEFGPSGSKIAGNFWCILSRLKAGMHQLWNWTELMLTRATNLEICASRHGNKTCSTNDKSSRCSDGSWRWKPVYDLANAGPRNRFTVLSNAGPMIVHNSVLGLGFQMGWRKFRLKYGRYIVDRIAYVHTEEFCEQVVHTYRKEWAPEVPKLWYGLEDAAVKTVWDGGAHEAFGIEYRLLDQWLTARLPSGRLIWYFNPKKVRKAMPWDENDIRMGFTYEVMKMGQWTTVTAFGGLLTENVVMGIERDIMVDGMFGLEAEGFPVVLDVHDEVVIEPLEAKADAKVFREIMLDMKPWVRQLQIPVDVPASDIWIGERYRK